MTTPTEQPNNVADNALHVQDDASEEQALTDQEQPITSWFTDEEENEDEPSTSEEASTDAETGQQEGEAGTDDAGQVADAQEGQVRDDEGSALLKLIQRATAAATQQQTPAAPPPPAAPSAVPVQYQVDDAELKRIADQYGADEPTMKAMVPMMQALVGQALGQYLPLAMTDRRAQEITKFFADEGIEGADVQTYLADLDAKGVNDLTWANTPAATKAMYLQSAGFAETKRMAKAKAQSEIAAAKIVPKTPAATAAVKVGSGQQAALTATADVTKLPEYAVLVKEAIEDFGMRPAEARQAIKELLEGEQKGR